MEWHSSSHCQDNKRKQQDDLREKEKYPDNPLGGRIAGQRSYIRFALPNNEGGREGLQRVESRRTATLPSFELSIIADIMLERARRSFGT